MITHLQVSDLRRRKAGGLGGRGSRYSGSLLRVSLWECKGLLRSGPGLVSTIVKKDVQKRKGNRDLVPIARWVALQFLVLMS